jgi:hypothetical protein
MMRTSFSARSKKTMQISWLWLVVGLLPYSIKRYQRKDEQVLSVKALFWRLTIRWRKECCSWEIDFPWIQRQQP